MKNLLPLLLIFLFQALTAQVTFENAFPNLTFNIPVDIQSTGVAGDNRLFVVEQPGRIRVFQNQSSTTFSNLFLDITNKVNFNFGQEKGLLGLAFHPNFNQNGWFYVSYTNNVNGVIGIVIERYSVNSNNSNQADPNSGCIVMSFLKNQGNSNHNGGSLAFGPDGLLYIAVGDGGGAGDPMGNSQNLNSFFGKILRININTSCPGYAIPGDNPLISSFGANEIYAWGLRNPWRISFDAQTNMLWAGDVGQGQFEEINIIQNGRNYGWNRYEANTIFNFSTPSISNPTFPIYSYNHTQGDRSITGGYVYRGSQINDNLFGRYVFGDFVSGRVWSLDFNPQTGATNQTLLFDTNFQISTFGKDINNELYFADYGNAGRIYKLIGNSNSPPPPSNCSVSVNGCSITLSGLNNSDFIKIFDVNFNEVWNCSPYGNNPNICNPTEVINDLGTGTYYVEACGVLEPYILTGCGQSSPCDNQGGDSDGDGVCNNQDCQPNNPAFPRAPGTPCNDGNPNTVNDVISGDGCGCSGTLPGGVCAVSVGNCSFTISGLNNGDFIKLFDAGFNEIWTCSPFGGSGNTCNSTEVINGLENGTYYIQGCQGEFDAYILNGCSQSNPCVSQGGDSDGDGTCNSQDCQPNNPSFPGTPGTSCNDGNPNTINDIVSPDGCSCSGTPAGGGCFVSVGNCSFTISGLNGGDFVKIFDAGFNEIWSCSPFGNNSNVCNSTEVISNLENGTYYVQGCQGDFDAYVLTGCGSSTDGCSVSVGTCALTISEIPDNEIIKIFDSNFNEIWNCSPFGDNCSSTEVVSGLGSGTYYVQGCQGDFDRYEVSCGQGSAPRNSTTNEFDNEESSISIFPNPVEDEINLELKSFLGQQALIQIFDRRGVLVKAIQIEEVLDHPEKIDLKESQNGLYILTIKIDSRRLISKSFIVNKLY